MKEIEKSFPETIEEAVDILLNKIKEEDKINVMANKQEDMIELHFSLGAWIRAYFGLWNKSNKVLVEACVNKSPDACSMIIVDALWKKLQKKIII